MLAATAVAFAVSVLAKSPTGSEAGLIQAIYSIRASLFFTTAALACWPFIKSSQTISDYWRLLKSAGLVLYLVHFYFTFGVIYQADVGAVYLDQGALIASSNFTLTIAWTLEVLLTAWRGEPVTRRWVVAQRALYFFVFTSFVVAAVLFRGGMIRLLGILAIVIIVGAWVARRVSR